VIVRAVKTGNRRPAIDFLNDVKNADLDLYAKLEDLIERVWENRDPPPKLPRDSTEDYGEGLLVLKARGTEKWGRITYAYLADSAIVLIDGEFKDQNRLSPATIQGWRTLLAKVKSGSATTFVAWETKPKQTSKE
jgi:hypothetical protein